MAEALTWQGRYPKQMLNQSIIITPHRMFFSLKAPNVTTACKLLSKINERNVTGLDKIPCKLLKLASGIVGSSLSSMFKRSVETKFFPNKWKVAKKSNSYL